CLLSAMVVHAPRLIVFVRASRTALRPPGRLVPAVGGDARRLARDIRSFITAGAGRNRLYARPAVRTFLRRGVAGLFRIIPLGVIFLRRLASRTRARPAKGC